jgi:hypothetical protein
MNNNYFSPGSWNIICDKCNQKKKSDDCRVQWDGIIACSACYDSKHPELEPLPIPIDDQLVPFSRPRPSTQNVDSSNDGLQIWGSLYETQQGFKSDLTWEAWDTYLGEVNDLPFTVENFPLR